MVIVLAMLTQGCSSIDVDPTADWTAEEFYKEARSALDAGEFQTAITNLETLEARFPFDAMRNRPSSILHTPITSSMNRNPPSAQSTVSCGCTRATRISITPIT